LELYTPRGSVSPLDKGYTAVAIAGIVIITYAIGMTMVSYVRQLRYTPASIGELQAVEENAA